MQRPPRLGTDQGVDRVELDARNDEEDRPAGTDEIVLRTRDGVEQRLSPIFIFIRTGRDLPKLVKLAQRLSLPRGVAQTCLPPFPECESVCPAGLTCMVGSERPAL